MRKSYFLGSFPPPYGGITVKNELLYSLLSDQIDVRPKEKCTYGFVLKALLCGGKFVLSPGHTEYLMFLSRLIACTRPRIAKKSIVFVVGGKLADLVEGDQRTLKALSKFRRLYVEPRRMYERLQAFGLENVSWFPNCRQRPEEEYLPESASRKLRCVFFSRIMREKGAENILSAAAEMPEVRFVFYGPIDGDYKERFEKSVMALENVSYEGLFKGNNAEIYQLLHQFDVMLLPTFFKTEGIPGALVEAKIAAIAAIVSDVSYNAEIVEDGVSGIVMKENTVEELVRAIGQIDTDRELLFRLKQGAKASAEAYYIENYISGVIDNLGGVIETE